MRNFVSIAFAVGMVCAVPFYLWRNHLGRTVLPDIPPSISADQSPESDGWKKVPISQIATRAGMRIAVADPKLKVSVEPAIRATFATLMTPDFKKQEVWRTSYGLPSRNAEPFEWMVEGQAKHFAKLAIDWDKAEYFLTQSGANHYYFQHDDFDIHTYLLTRPLTHAPQNGALKLPKERTAVVCRVPIRFPQGFEGPLDGYLVIYMTTGVPEHEWALEAIGVTSSIADWRKALGYLPFVN